MAFLIYTLSFKTIQSIFFFKMPNFNFPRWQPSLVPVIVDGLPYPSSPGVPPIFFHRNNGKGCTLDYLDGLGHFMFGFGATGKSSRGSDNPPGRTRVKDKLVYIPLCHPFLMQIMINL